MSRQVEASTRGRTCPRVRWMVHEVDEWPHGRVPARGHGDDKTGPMPDPAPRARRPRSGAFDRAAHDAGPGASLNERAAVRLDRIASVLWRILWLNLAVAIAKLAYGWKSGAIAMTADGIHSLLDASSNVVGLAGLSVARRPPDANHPYGHRKYETFAALGVAVMLFAGCQEVVQTVIARL